MFLVFYQFIPFYQISGPELAILSMHLSNRKYAHQLPDRPVIQGYSAIRGYLLEF